MKEKFVCILNTEGSERGVWCKVGFVFIEREEIFNEDM